MSRINPIPYGILQVYLPRVEAPLKRKPKPRVRKVERLASPNTGDLIDFYA